MALAHALILGLGGLLIAIPIILHLLMQPKPKALQFPALRFVKEMRQTNQRSLNLRHWLLLLLRCLLLLAVAAAFARPSTSSSDFGNWLGLGVGAVLSLFVGLLLLYALLWSKPANIPLAFIVGLVFALLLAYTGYTMRAAFNTEAKHILADQQAPVATVLLIDNSPRLSYVRENESLLEKVQDQGRWLISQLPLNSKVAIMESKVENPFFSVDISAARKRLNTLDINYASEPLPDSLQQAVKFLSEKTDFERKEVYVFTDLTRVSWNTSGDSLRLALEEHPEVSLFVFDVGVEDPQNFSLGELKLSATSVPINGNFEIETQVRSNGEGGEFQILMKLEQEDLTRPFRQDGKTVVPERHWISDRSVQVQSNSIASVNLEMQEQFAEGVHHGVVEIRSGDALAVDDRRYFTIEVRPSWKVLVAHPRGVNPRNMTDLLAGGAFDVTTIPQQDLAGERLSEYSTIFLLDPTPITDPLWRTIQEYVELGGSLGVFLGQNASRGREPDAAFRSDAAADVLPGRLVRDWFRKEPDRFLSLGNMTHPVLKEFRPMASLGIFQAFPIYRHWEIDYGQDPNVEVIARFTNGLASLLQRNLGQGKVICMTTPITEPASPQDRASWNELFNSGRGPQIWPGCLLVDRVASFLASGNRDRVNLGVGQSVVLQNDTSQLPLEYRLFTPRDEDPVRVSGEQGLVRYKFTDTPGHYRLKGLVQDEKPTVRGFSVNMPGETTDLMRIDPESLDDLLGEERYQLARDRDEIEQQQGTTRLGQEFYPVLALSMALLLALELIMSNRFYKN